MTTPKYRRRPDIVITVEGVTDGSKSYFAKQVILHGLLRDRFHVTSGEADPPPRNPTQTWVHVVHVVNTESGKESA